MVFLLFAVAWASVPRSSSDHHPEVYGAPWVGADGWGARGSWPFDPGDGPPDQTHESGRPNGGRGEGDHGHGSNGRGDFGCSADPSKANLKAAFHRTLDSFLNRARHKYGHLYYDFHKSYQIMSLDVGPSHGTVTIHYQGSVKERGNGDVIRASGGASASYKWVGCHWVNTDISY